jgi:hypothetical protein
MTGFERVIVAPNGQVLAEHAAWLRISSSHACNAFGAMYIAYEEPAGSRNFNRKIEMPKVGIA